MGDEEVALARYPKPWTYDFNAGFPRVVAANGKEVCKVGWTWDPKVETALIATAKYIVSLSSAVGPGGGG